MVFKEIPPDQRLRPFVKCFYFYESQSSADYDDTVYPSGNTEVIFNLGKGRWQAKRNDVFYTTPAVEVWGQITKPLAIRSLGENVMLGVRFYPHSMAFFSRESLADLNNEVTDASMLFGSSVHTLHQQLLETPALPQRIALLEDYFLKQLVVTEKRYDKIKLVGNMVSTLAESTGNERITELSVRNKISSRYVTQLFSQYTGIQPKLLSKINRFQYSLSLISSRDQDLTSIAYDAGYFDQSHFIREFKLFTGITPNAFATRASAMNQALAAS
jgi:AraC-like DNA-binding protein